MREQRASGSGGHGSSSGANGESRAAGSPTGSISSCSASSSSGAGVSSGDGTPNGGTSAVQFLAIRSRVGKRFQAAIPDLLDDSERATKRQMQPMHVPKSQFIPDRAHALGDELERYLALARTLRDGATFETEEQVHAIALQYLHRFDYNATDAACSLYARHSIEVPKTSASGASSESSSSSRVTTSAEEVAKWLAEFYELLRARAMRPDVVAHMTALRDRAATHSDIQHLTEAGVLRRLVARIEAWTARSQALATAKVPRGDIALHVHAADALELVTPDRDALERRIEAFDAAFTHLKDALERGSRRNQSKVDLPELERLYAAVTAPNIAFPDEAQYVAIVNDARSLAATIAAMLKEDKVSLPAMRDVLAKIEVVPVSFERDVALFQQKMLSAQTWLAKARKCIPKRRGSRRSGGTAEPKKMDLSAIRALVDDAPCGDSAEMFEMQDLLECADEWAEKVTRAIEGGSSEITLEELKELYDEGNDMPVDMAEQTFLEAEIAAREWCVKAAAMLAANKPLRALERLADDAKAIRVRLHAKKQARWKPQVERDIHAAIDTARRWVNEVRDVVGSSAFDKLLSSASAGSAATTATEHASHAASASHQANDKAKKPLASIAKLLDKSERLVVNVSAYVDALKALQCSGYALRADVRALLIGIGCLPKDAPGDASAAAPVESSDASAAAPEAASAIVNSSSAGASGTASATTTEPSTPADVSATASEPVERAAPVDFSNFAHAAALLERVFALPFHFDEGSALEAVIAAEKDWAQRVRDALPPRQSRKKRQAKHPVTLELLEQLLLESKQLHFRFPDELKVLVKELDELRAWQRKARDVVETPVAEHIAALVPKLRDHDSAVYRKLQAAKQKLAEAQRGTSAASTTSGDHEDAPSTTAMETDVPSSSSAATKDESSSSSSGGGGGDVEMADASSDVQTPAASASVEVNGTAEASASSAPAAAPVAATCASKDAAAPTSAAAVLVPIDAAAILSHVRLESGCMQREAPSDASKDDATATDDATVATKAASPSASGRDSAVSLLEPVLALAEKSLDDIAALEARGERVNILETLELASSDVASSSAFTDDAVKTLETWRDQIAQVVDEGELLSAVAPELQSLATVVDLLTWLQSARSLFYDEMLPLRELVAQGQALARALERMQASSVVSAEALATLECMLWPLPHLEAQDAIVESWTQRVRACIAEKRVSVATFARLLDDGSALLMEPDAFKVIHDEVKRAKTWLSKLKKRVKALITKRVTRLSMSVARSFVDDGDDVVLETPVFDLLKDNVDVASDWETRVLASGIESGHARIATLVSLLNEYDCAGLLIDLDTHRDVLKSATERYCICRQPFDGLMIGCDFCDDWFHDNCIGMSKEKAEKVEHYTCPSCTILHDLSTALASVNDAQRELWNEVEYVKSFDKQHGVLARKLKREEKAVEKSEHQVASCSSQMNQLRVAIDDLERRKSAAAVAPVRDAKLESAVQPSRVVNAAAPLATSAGAGSATAAVELPHQPPQPHQQQAPATAASAASSQTAPLKTPVAASPVVKTEGSNVTASSPPASAAAPTEAPSSVSPQPSALPSQSGDAKTVVASAQTPSAPAPTKVAESPAPATVTSVKLEAKASAGQHTAPLAAAGGGAGGGDMTEQLTKMRNAHAELMLQLHDAQESLRLSKVRLQIAQDGLKELRTSHDARKSGLERAQSWVCRAVTALNTTSLLSREALLLRDEYVPDAYAALLAEVATALTAALTEPAPWTAHIDTIFPEVRAYARLLRLVGWSLVVVSLLQERPSREKLSQAIAYAGAHGLWDGKTVGPLKGVLSRMDAWILKVHKSVAKTGLSKSQKLPRLKLFLNEYSKLPLTCTPLAETLEAYIAAAEATVSAGQSAEHVKQTYDAAESAVLTAFSDAAAALAAAPTMIGVANGGGGASPATAAAQSKAPRKRKPYVRREKPLSAKKLKKSASSSDGHAARDSVETHQTSAEATD